MTTCGIIILFWLLLAAVGTLVNNVRIRRIAERRKGETFGDFAAYFAERSVPDEILKHTYEYFEEWNSDSATTFPVRATDNVYDIYGIVDEDLDDAVMDILSKSGRIPQAKEQLLQLPPLETVEDVVIYVAAAPKAET